MSRPRSFSLNENYFETIDTPNKGYILGFLYADGSINNGCLSISLSKKDEEILEFIKNELEFGGNIRTYSLKKHEYVRLSITSKKMINDLNNLGVIKNKTYESKKLPTVSKEFLPHLIRGFFDGDGSIYCIKRPNRSPDFCVNFSSNTDVLNEIKTALLNINITSGKIRYRNGNSLFSAMLDVKGAINIEKFMNFIYCDNSFRLSRKFEIFQIFLNVINSMSRRLQSKDTVNKIIELYNNGLKQYEISNSTEINFSTVRSTVQRFRKKGLIK